MRADVTRLKFVSDEYGNTSVVPSLSHVVLGTLGFHFVTAYESWREFGGPEEGGWWYTRQEPIESKVAFTEWGEVQAVTRLREKYGEDSNIKIFIEEYPGELYRGHRSYC